MESDNKVLIALFRRGGSGKTTTLNKVIDKLGVNYTINNVRETSFSPKDRLVTIDINGIIVGISTGGDNESIVKKRINELLEKKCNIIVTATRSKGETTRVVNEFIKKNNYKVDWIEKSATYSEDLDKEEFDNRNKKYNEVDSEVILQAIFHHLN